MAYRYDGDTQTIFIDGQEAASGDGLGGVGVESEIVIGATRGDQDRDFSGDLDDIRIYNFGLPATFIADIANGDQPGGGPVDPPPSDGEGITEVVKGGNGGPISFSFPEGTTYDVEYSTDLENWEVIASDVTGMYEDSDAARNGAEEGYYRGVEK